VNQANWSYPDLFLSLDPRDESTFQRSKLNWNEIGTEAHAAMLRWYQELIRLRRESSALTDGRMDLVETAFDEDEGWLRVERGPLTLVCNVGNVPRSVPLARNRAAAIRLSSNDHVAVNGSSVLLPPNSVVVLSSPP
jgi:maltooligosyltrehalose trehalohydrolase